MKKLVRYVNEDTGEFVEKEYKTIDYYNDDGYLYKHQARAIRSFFDRPLPRDLSYADKGRLNELAYHIMGDQLIGYRSGNVVKPHTVTTIARLLKYSDKHTRALINKAKELNIIREVVINNVTYFMYNPLYGLGVKRLSLFVYIAFQDVLADELPKWVINRFTMDVKEYNPDIKIIK